MKTAVRVALAAAAAAVCVGPAAGAGSLRAVEANGADYPDHAYILTLPAPKSLQRSQVTVTENGGPVSNLQVLRQGTAASSAQVVLAIDSSASMTGRPYSDALAAARAFARQMKPGQDVAIVTFNDNVDVLQGFTDDQGKILKALDSNPKLAVGTKINDALDQSLGMFADGTPSTSIVLLSDGKDVGSEVKRGKVLSELEHGHVRVFSVGLVSPQYSPAALQGFANASHGSYLVASSPSQLAPIFDTLGRQLSNEYLLHYRSQQNPQTLVHVHIAVDGVPGAVNTTWRTPALQFTDATVYHRSLVDRVVQSSWTMIAVAILLAVIFGWAVSHATKGRKNALVERVSGFVSVQRESRQSRSLTQEERITRSLLARVRPDTSKSRLMERLGSTLELADLQIEPIQLVALTAAGTILAMVILAILIGPIGLVVGAATPLIVRGFVLRRISRKRSSFAEQLPDNLDVLASALRAGHSLVSALTVVADDAVEPAKGEFRRVIAEEQFGVQLEDAFQVVVERMQNRDLDQVALVARLQREVGSNSAEVLDRVVDTVRARMELRRLVQTLTAQGRFSRWVLTGLPVGLAVLLTVVGGNYMKPLFHTTSGQFLLIAAVVMVAAGSYAIKKIVDIRVF